MILKDYHIEKHIHKGNAIDVFKATHHITGEMVALKVIKDAGAQMQHFGYFKNEYTLLSHIEHPHIRKVFSLLDNGKALVMEYCEWNPLKKYIETQPPLQPTVFIPFAKKIVEALRYLHQNKIIHKDFTPNNILVSDDFSNIKIIDLGISTQLSRQVQELANPENLEGTLDYISPEQTGRMNRTIDYRSDYYSMGVMFYELLTGKVPFESDDAMQVVHAHIALEAQPITQLNPSIPASLQAVVSKLMAKNAEDRYQSAAGILKDLDFIERNLENPHILKEFILGLDDYSDKFQIPQKLYGREKEIHLLLDTFEVAANGENQFLVVKGFSGIGKSALVQEIHKPITEKRGYFIAGKFDQFKKNIPYSAIIQAFTDLVRQILTEKPDEIETWKILLSEALSTNAQVIIDVIPDVELIMGKQAPVVDLGAMEAQNRFKMTFEKFISVFAGIGHPLTIFLDDLQWADSGTLALLETVLVSPMIQYLFIIGSYRDNEVVEGDTLSMALKQISVSLSIKEIKIEPLQRHHISQLLIDTLHIKSDLQNPAEVNELAHLIHQKTEGNPFFVNELLKDLFLEEIFNFDYQHNSWRWEFEKIQAHAVTGNVVELILQKMKKLPTEVADLLKVGACIGSFFEISDFENLLSYPPDELQKAAETAINEGFLMNVGKERAYRFVHDRIQQASYALMDEATKKQLHYSIGKTLLLHEKADEHIFEIVNHLNKCTDTITEPSEKEKLAYYNAQASQKAVEASAYRSALNFAQIAVSLLSPYVWQENYELALLCYTSLTETGGLCYEYEAMQKGSETVCKNAKNAIDKARTYEVQALYHLSLEQYPQSIAIGIEGINALGFSLPKKGNIAIALWYIFSTKLYFPKQLPDVSTLPVSEDPRILWVNKLLAIVGTSTYYADINLSICSTCLLVQIAWKHGFSPLSTYCMLNYGVILGTSLNQRDNSFSLAAFAHALVEKFNAKFIMPKLQLVDNLFNKFMQIPMKKMVADLDANTIAALEVGDLQFAGHSISVASGLIFSSGTRLDNCREKLKDYLAQITNIKQFQDQRYVGMISQVVANFMEKTTIDDVDVLNGEYFNEIESIKKWEKSSDITGYTLLYYYKAYFAYILGKHENALKYAELCVKHKGGAYGQYLPMLAEYYFIPKALFALQRSKSSHAKKNTLAIAKKKLKKFRFFAEKAPFNFGHKYKFIEAEIEYAKGNLGNAFKRFDEAITQAKENEYLHDEAYYNEVVGEIFLQEGATTAAQTYLSRAYILFMQWGCMFKVRLLQEKYGNLISSAYQNPNPVTGGTVFFGQTHFSSASSTTTSTIRSSVNYLDMSTVLKTSQVLAGEVQLRSLLDKMMHLLLENAGAQRGIMIENREGKLWIQTELEGDKLDILQEIPIDHYAHRVCVSLVRFVERTKKFMVIDDATKNEQFGKDDYIAQQKVKSIFCVPLINKGKLSAILYLENNLATGAFTTKQVELIVMLSTQIAISMDNAILYENLEQKVAERTAEVNKQKEDIIASITYAKRIQEAILPQKEKVKEFLPHSFIYFKPRDIVSGDFYWFSEVKKEGKYIVVAADCTGHGVPGAFMSMIGSELLSRIVNEQEIYSPERILNELQKGIRNSLNQAQTEAKDGMDIAICTVSPALKLLEYAGAMNPLYYIRKTDNERQLVEIKADKVPIGGNPPEKFSYQKHSILIDVPTTFYICSDGYQDQFGGQKGRKFMVKNLRELLFKIHTFDFENQYEILDSTLQAWAGEHKQIDDILIWGFELV